MSCVFVWLRRKGMVEGRNRRSSLGDCQGEMVETLCESLGDALDHVADDMVLSMALSAAYSRSLCVGRRASMTPSDQIRSTCHVMSFNKTVC